jgi:F420-dependent oxidoreductase-like protein
MKIGLAATSPDIEVIIDQARWMEADGFSSLWFGYAIQHDPIAAMAVVGRETSTLELGTSVLQTYPCHPLLQANRAASVVSAIGRGMTLGIGPSHKELVQDLLGISYDHPGRSTEEYTQILAQLLRGETVDVEGDDWTLHLDDPIVLPHRVPLMLSAMSPRMLRIAGELTDGTITFLARTDVLETHIVPKVRAAAQAAGRPEPRIVAGVSVAVHDDPSEVRSALAERASILDPLPNYRRVLDLGGYASAADAVITGNAAHVKRELQNLVDAGATEVWTGITAAGDDPEASRRRTLDTLRELLD